MKIAIFGLGYVGCVTAGCMAQLGHEVFGIDTNPHKVEQINRGEAPFFEPGLDDLLREAVRNGRIRASTTAREALREARIALICVGTPSNEEGHVNMEYLDRVCMEIAGAGRAEGLIVSIRSTVYPGTNEDIHTRIFGGDPRIRMVANPEFLREGSAVRDFLEPSLIVVGGQDPDSVKEVASLYAGLAHPVETVGLRAAEMIKFACNAFHATKIAFANEIGSICLPLGISGGEVMRILCRDTKLNTSAAYLRPGFAFGGSCLPKDLRALGYQARRASLDLPLLENVLASNGRHLERLVNRVREESDGNTGIYGLSFKENTDDLRESPVIALVERLIQDKRSVRIFDPHIDLSLLHGANQTYLRNHLPDVERVIVPGFEKWLEWCSSVVLTQKPAPQKLEAISRSGKKILDLTV